MCHQKSTPHERITDAWSCANPNQAGGHPKAWEWPGPIPWRVSFNCDFLRKNAAFPPQKLADSESAGVFNFFKLIFFYFCEQHAKCGWHPCSWLVLCILAVMSVQQLQGALGISLCMAGQLVHAY